MNCNRKDIKLFVCVIMLIMTMGHPVRAQYIRINDAKAKSALYVDLDRLFNFNLYEHARFGAGFYLATPANDPKSPQWQISAYAGYGTFDKGWKYGASVALQSVGTHRWRPYVSYYDDLAQMSSIRLEGYSLLSTFANTSYVASHFARVRCAEVGTSAKFNKINAAASVRYVTEWLLYDAYGDLLYPNLYEEQMPRENDYTEANVRLTRGEWTLDLRAGSHDGYWDEWYGRAILQYNKSIGIGKKGILSLFGQSGYSTTLTPYQHLFDLSGTFGSCYYFNNTLLTLAPNTFVTDLYSRSCVSFKLDHPLWNTPLSHPSPFVQLGGAVGRDIRHNSRTLCVMEPAIGVEGLLRWGYLDLGVAAAYRFSNNEGAFPYPANAPSQNYPFAIMAVAKLLLDKYP